MIVFLEMIDLNVPYYDKSDYFRIQRQKGHPTLVTQIDLILQHWCELKVLVTIGLNSLSSCTLFYSYIALFTVHVRDFEPTPPFSDYRRRNLEKFYFVNKFW